MKTVLTLLAGAIVGVVGAVAAGIWLFKDEITSAVDEEEDIFHN